MPWMCRSPKNERFQPVNGNQAIGAGTPTLMPIMPALKCCLNCRAAQPLRVKIDAPLPYGQSRPIGQRFVEVVDADDREHRAEDLLVARRASPGSTRSSTLGPIRKPSPSESAERPSRATSAPSCLADVEIAGHAVAMLARDDRAHVDVGAAVGRADFHLAGASGRAVRPAESATLPTGTATLPAMQRSPAQPNAESWSAPDGLVEVGIGHDDQMVLRPAGRLHALAVLRAGLVDVLGDRRRADERDRAHQRMSQAAHRRIPGRRARC